MAISPVNIGNNAGTRGVPTDMDNALEIYSGLVLTAFDRKNIALDHVMVKTVQSGSSVQFPIIARSLDNSDVVRTHVPGTELSTNDIPVKDRVINIDTLEYYSLAINKFEEKILHFETRSELGKQAGEALATTIDKDVFAQVLLASQTSGTIGGSVMQPDGSEVNNDVIDSGTTAEAKGDALLDAIYEGVTLMAEKDITGEKVFITTPRNYNYLVQSQKGVHKDYTSGNGDIGKGTIIEIAGVKILWSNNLPVTDTIANDTANSVETGVNVGGTDKKFQGLLFNSACVGVVKLMDITTESNYLPKQLDTLLTSYYSYGMGVLNPGASCVITGGTQV